jgi:hypothetical protein
VSDGQTRRPARATRATSVTATASRSVVRAAPALIGFVAVVVGAALALAGCSPPTVGILKTAEQVQRGSLGDEAVASGQIVVVQVPPEQVPRGAVTSVDAIATLVARTDIAPGVVVDPSMFVDPGAAPPATGPPATAPATGPPGTDAAAPPTDSTVPAAPVQTNAPVPVYVVTATVPVGTPGQEALDTGLIVPGSLDPVYLPSTGVATAHEIESGRSTVELHKGDLVVAGMFR